MEIEIYTRPEYLVLIEPNAQPIIILRDTAKEKSLALWIGSYEREQILVELFNVVPPRPLTHDLTKNIMATLGGMLKKIVINDLQDDTFFALLYIDKSGEEIQVDARPSDAIALALRFSVPLFAEDIVFRRAIEGNETFYLGIEEFLSNLDEQT